jgi:SynChlorMet cassette protein ScmC
MRKARAARFESGDFIKQMIGIYSFVWGGGAKWNLAAGDPAAEPILAGLAAAMQLTSPGTPERNGARTVRIFSSPLETPSDEIACVLPRPKTPEDIPFTYYTAISQALARGLLRDGGVLLHGALAEYRPQHPPGKGVIFSAPGGAGKSTASRRLPGPWRSLSDDATLVMPDGSGAYRAHPWPTWSLFYYGDRAGGGWDVQSSVPLRACIFLQRSSRDALEPLGEGQAASLLTESARQMNFMDARLPPDERRSIRTLRFDAICKAAKAVPAFRLGISLEGEFWREVERVLG